MTADTRVWMYRIGEARVFASPADVPQGEGWQDTPPSPDQKPAEKPEPKTRSKKAEKDGDGP